MTEEPTPTLLDTGAGKILAGVLTAIVVGGLGQSIAIYTWTKVAETQLKTMGENISEIKADLKEATTDRFRGSDAKESHKALWEALREHKH